MSKNGGRIVQFKTKDGQEKRGHIYYRDQIQGLRERNQVVITEIDDEGKDVIKAGRRVMHFRGADEFKQIGFID